jgi:hypothetical protein
VIEIARRYEQRWCSDDGGSANYESVDGGPTELVIVRPGWVKAERHLFAVQIPEGWLQFHPDGSIAARGCGILEGGPSVDIFQVDPAGVPFSSSMGAVCYSAFTRGDGRPVFPCTHDQVITVPAASGSEFEPDDQESGPPLEVPPLELEAPVRAPSRLREALKKLNGNGSSEKPADEPESEPVSREVQQAAEAITAAVRRGALSVAELSRGLQPEAFAGYLDYAVSQGWVSVEGDRLRLGAVDSRGPAETYYIPN